MTGHRYSLYAQEPGATQPTTRHDPKDAIKSETLWITVGLLALALVIGAVVLAAVDRWRKKTNPFDVGSVEEVSNFREMYESGEITHAEYERIRNKVSDRVKETVGVKSPPTSPPAPSAPADGTLPGPPSGNPG
jgi:hypothetical protein